ncbi:hypothetical protein [Actinomadura fibrosa]|nr:hypothetical protein [Actinomadura fibrosa]
MSSGARHGIGAVIGLVATPVIAVCLLFGTERMTRYFRYFFASGGDRWSAAAALLVAAVVLGLVMGTRLSPLASLIPGAVFAAVGLLWIVAPRWSLEHTTRKLPDTLDRGYQYVGPYGVFLLIGVALVVASVFPSRWQARTPTGAAPRFGGPPPAPMGPPQGAPMGTPQHLGGPPPPGQEPSWQRPPQYGQPAGQQYGAGLPGGPGQYGGQPAQFPPATPPAPPAAPPSPYSAEESKPKPSAQRGSDDDTPGEWTQMYGGDDLRGGGNRPPS